MATVHFTSSSSFMEHDPKAGLHVEVEILDYIEGTYDVLRHGNGCGEGKEFAAFVNGAWELPDGRRFSDWAVAV